MLNTLDDREYQNYEENWRLIKSMGVYLKRLEQRYMKEQNEIDEMYQIQQSSLLVNNILFCDEWETCTENDSERKQYFLKHSNNKETYTGGSKRTERKIGFAAVFVGIIRRGALPEEASIHTTEITAIKKNNERDIKKKREGMRWVIQGARGIWGHFLYLK